MVEMKIEPMDADTFLEWCTRQEASYELVDGLPRMMSPVRRAHAKVVRNGLVALSGKLKGRSCQPFAETVAVRVPNGNVRLPDLLVDCGSDNPDLLHAERPVLIVEVLSRSTRQIDQFRKLAEYQQLPTLQYILIIEPDEASGVLHTRQSVEAWSSLILVGGDTEIPMPALGIAMTLSEFYE